MAAEFPNAENPEEPFDQGFEIPDFSALENIGEKPSARPETFDEVMRTATAIIDRDHREIGVEGRFLNGSECIELDDLDRAFNIFQSAELLSRVENPDVVLDPDDMVRSMTESGMLSSAAQKLSGGELSEADAKQLLHDASKAISDMPNSVAPEELTKNFKSKFEAAELVANDHGCTIADVMENDDLYLESIRGRTTPEEVVEKQLNNKENEERLVEAFLSLTGIEITDEAREAGLESVQESNKSLAIFKVVRTWDVETLESLPDSYKERLGIDENTIERHLVRGAPSRGDAETRKRDNVLRTAFAKQWLKSREPNYYSMSTFNRLNKGGNVGDYKNPTAEELRELRMQPVWIRPLQ
jgi:hypothetical protein